MGRVKTTASGAAESAPDAVAIRPRLPRRRGLVAIVIRLWALAARFLIIMVLALFLPVADVGIYGLLSATVAYVTFALGLDMYAYTTRELIGSDRSKWRTYLTSHGAFLILMQLLFLPATVLLFVWGLLPWSTLVWFVLLVSTEQIGNEIDRVLVAMSEQLWASMVIFVRQGLMPTLIIPVFALFPAARDLNTIFAAWVACNALAIVLGLRVIVAQTTGGVGKRVDARWLAKGLGVSLQLLIGTLCLRALFSVDRQLVAHFGGLETVGVYSLAMGLAAGLTSLVAVGVHQFQYPRLVKWAHSGNRAEFITDLKRLWWSTLGLVIAAVAGVAVVIGPLLAWIGKAAYLEEQWAFIAAMAAVGLYNVSLVPHFALYAIRGDRAIVMSSVASLAVWALAWVCFLRLGVIQAAIVALAFASLTLGVGKFVAYLRLAPSSGISRTRVAKGAPQTASWDVT